MHIDLLSPETFAQGHPVDQYQWLQDNAPLYWHDEPDGRGFWVVTRYEDVAEIGRQAHIFSSEPTVMIEDPIPGEGANVDDEHKMMLMMDPPQHTQFRKIISREFTRGPAAALKPRVAELASRIIDNVIDRGECEFVSEVAGELPSYVIAELTGIPLEDGRELYKLTEIIHSAAETLPENAQRDAVLKMFGYAQGVYRDKLANPSEDLASQIIHAEVEGRRLDEIDFQLFFMLLIDAGGDTTRNLVAGGLHLLMQHPEKFQDWRQHRSADLDASARDELLRMVCPVIQFRRTLMRDVELHGQTLKEVTRLCATSARPITTGGSLMHPPKCVWIVFLTNRSHLAPVPMYAWGNTSRGSRSTACSMKYSNAWTISAMRSHPSGSPQTSSAAYAICRWSSLRANRSS